MTLLFLGIILMLFNLPAKYSFHGKPEKVLLTILDESTYVTADQAARMLVADDNAAQLIDLRSAVAFDSFAIPGAINMPYEQLLSMDIESHLNRGKQNIFYANDDLVSGYAIAIAQGLGFKNNAILKGGLNEWYRVVMNSNFTGERLSARENALYENRFKARRIFIEVNSMPDSLKAKYRALQEIERRKLDGGCE
ncbi:MAG: rhodanese-like domain-containing protein [Bacteroidales bacterium]|nr:rhodanese-like domain-containing protein [Bacteroidales bacterium]